MKSKQCLTGALLAFVLVFVMAGIPLVPRPAQASYEDAAIFYDELSPHGNWVDYDKYGPVWYPNNVEEDWRPYINGRWTPSEQGYMFETDEPWGWATYHYGNWMPTEDYGWVWSPGRTWYPNTVAWRNSPEDAPVDTSYIGWAPIPPPNYTPPPAYADPGYAVPYTGYGGGVPGLGGSPLNLLTAPFWIFAQASRFLLGFGQPYSPAYSYMGSGILAPPSYYPMIYPTTVIVRDWYYPSYYRRNYFGDGYGLGAYSWGPPVRYVSHVTRIEYVTINNYMRHAHPHKIHGGWPDERVFHRNRYLRHIVPSENPLTWSRPTQVRNVDQAVRHLGNPRAIIKPADLRPLDAASLPKARPAAFTGERPAKVRGMQLPRRAQQQITPQMEERLRKISPVAAQGPGGPGRGQAGRGQWVRPEDSQRGAIRGPQGPQRMGRGQPEVIEGQRGLRKGPGEGPETSRGLRRGPVEGFQGPGAGGVRRGPGEPPQGAQGLRRGPGDAPQGASQGGRGRPEGFQPSQQRRLQLEQQQIMRQQQQQQGLQQQQLRRQQEQMRRQQAPQQLRQQQEQQQRRQMLQQRRQQLEQQPRQQIQQQQFRRQQEQQRRQQFRQQQEQSRQQLRQFQRPQRAQQVQRQQRERPQQHSQFQRLRDFQDR
ncbi:MAG: hypothetical protein QME75_08545 [Deltaproteobacteria bacterium]|nr:hypothetical protein [Deltaproteobacteria bacterium]